MTRRAGTRRPARLVTLALGMVAATASGCSLLVGLGEDAVPAALDGAVDASTLSPESCEAGTGWQRDCSFFAVFARQAVGPGTVFSYAAANGLFAGATLDNGGLKTLVTGYQTDGTISVAPDLFEGGALAVTAADLAGFQVKAAITTADLDATIQSLTVEVHQGMARASVPLGQVEIDDPSERPRSVAFVVDSTRSSVFAFISANFVVDGSTLPGIATLTGSLSAAPYEVGVSYAGRDEPGDATYPFTPPLERTRAGVGLAAGNGNDFWLGGVTRDDAGAAELFLDASSAPPSLRIPLPFIPESAASPAQGILLGRTTTGVALQQLPYPVPDLFADPTALPALVEIPLADVAQLGPVRAAWNGSDQITAFSLRADGTLVCVQWTLTQLEAGTATAQITTNAGFGSGGVLRVPFPSGTQLGDVTYDLGAYYFTVQFSDGDDVLLRLVDPSADGGP